MIVFFENNIMYYTKSRDYPMLKSVSIIDRVKVPYSDLKVGNTYYLNSKLDNKAGEMILVTLDKISDDEFYFMVNEKLMPFDEETIIVNGLNQNNYTFYKSLFQKESNLIHEKLFVTNGRRFQLTLYRNGIIKSIR